MMKLGDWIIVVVVIIVVMILISGIKVEGPLPFTGEY
jgi:hypothetical protein